MTKDCGIRNADCGFSRVAMQRTVPAKTAQHVQSIRIPHSKIRNGVTLIELLIVIAIIATLSTVFLGVSTAAMEHSRASRTKATIAKIHTLLMERWESYETRRVDIKQTILEDIEANATNSKDRGLRLANARLNATRELMKLEMPDRWSDITGVRKGNPWIGPPAYPVAINNRPALCKSYLRRYDSLSGESEKITSNQGSECLYMIIMLTTGDGEARTLFGEQDIGDTDNDGAPEFLDGWGQPIEWMRWPVGFVDQSDLMSGDPDADHDPLDHFRIQQDAFRILPLVYSRGSDGIFDVAAVPDAVTSLNPYTTAGNSGTYLGKPRDNPSEPDGDNNWIDNIHNHLQDNR